MTLSVSERPVGRIACEKRFPKFLSEVIRDMMYLSCSFDHRVIDGHVGAAFVQSVRNALEHPALLFVDLA